MPESSNALEFGSTALFKSGLWTQLVNSKIPIVMVPSLDDTVVFPVFPQCPYEKVGRTAETLSYAGNPRVLEVGDLRIGGTNCDILMDLMNNCYMR